MNLHSLPLFAALKNRMDWLNQRQQVLAQNIANANTPNYQGKDLKEPSFKQLLSNSKSQKQLTVAQTHHTHLASTAPPPPKYDEDRKTQAYETSPDGNAVVLEEQLLKIADTRMNYEITTNLYRKHVDMFRMAISRR